MQCFFLTIIIWASPLTGPGFPLLPAFAQLCSSSPLSWSTPFVAAHLSGDSQELACGRYRFYP